jgi:tight adherence protein B
MRLSDPAALEWAAIALAGASAFVAAYGAFAGPDAIGARAYARYRAYLQKRADALLLDADLGATPILQGLVVYGLVAAAIALREPRVLFGVPIVLALPAAILDRLRHRRIAAIEAQTDTFIVALASALRSTPSIADAFLSLAGVVGQPLRGEIGVATKQMRVGATLEEALLLMGKRVESRAFDTALASVLIGQRVGGNLPTILASTGAAIRELHRLDRAAKSKTSTVRIQMWAIAFAPLVVTFAMERFAPNYFGPIMESRWGIATLGVSAMLWMLALLVGRRILAVTL